MSNASPEVSLQLVVEADADPHLPARLLGRLTVRNELPPSFAFEVGDADTVTLAMRLPAMGLEAAERLAHQFRAIATVRAVTLVARGRAAAEEELPPCAT